MILTAVVLSVAVELARLAALGLAICALFSWRAQRASTLFLLGLVANVCLVPLFGILARQAGGRPAVVAVWLASWLAAGAILWHRRAWEGLTFRARTLLWPLGSALFALAVAAFVLANDYRAGRLLDADAQVFWALRGHFLFEHGLASRELWQVMHPDYPLLLPLLNAYGYFLFGASGEIPTVAIAYLLAFVALYSLGESLLSVVGRGAAIAIPVLFVLAPVPIFPIHPRVLLAGYAEVWSILLVALAGAFRPELRKEPLSTDESVVLLVISSLKNEGFLFAMVYVAARFFLLSTADGPRAAAVRTSLARAGLSLFPAIVWLAMVGASRSESHYDFFVIPSVATLAERLLAFVDFYRELPWLYGLVPLILFLLPFTREKSRAWEKWVAFHAAAFYGLLAAVVLSFHGSARLVLENSFHRLHWPLLLLALFAAARMATRRRELD